MTEGSTCPASAASLKEIAYLRGQLEDLGSGIPYRTSSDLTSEQFPSPQGPSACVAKRTLAKSTCPLFELTFGTPKWRATTPRRRADVPKARPLRGLQRLAGTCLEPTLDIRRPVAEVPADLDRRRTVALGSPAVKGRDRNLEVLSNLDAVISWSAIFAMWSRVRHALALCQRCRQDWEGAEEQR